MDETCARPQCEGWVEQPEITPYCEEHSCGRLCPRPRADDSEYCAWHRDIGPKVMAGPPGLEPGDEIQLPEVVTLAAYERDWARCPHIDELGQLAVSAAERLDPDNVLSLRAYTTLFEQLNDWLLWSTELHPMRVVVTPDELERIAADSDHPVAEPPAGVVPMRRHHMQDLDAMAALWRDNTTFFGAAQLARELVQLVVVPAIGILYDAPADGTLVATSVALAGAWNRLKSLRVSLSEEEGEVFTAVHEHTWAESDLRDRRGFAIQRGVSTSELQELLRFTMPASDVEAVLGGLQDQGILTDRGGMWRIVY